MARIISFERAKEQYIFRFTMEHVPRWAFTPAPNGLYHAPQFRSDAEWYANTLFPGESEIVDAGHCYTSHQTWPLGQWLHSPYIPKRCIN